MSTEQPFERLSRARRRQLQQLRATRGRRQQGRFLLDGEKLVRDALEAGAPIEELLSLDPRRWAQHGHPLTRLIKLTKLSRADAERLSDTTTPQGHFAVVRDPLDKLRTPASDAWQVVALDAVQDAGNVGGIIRSAAAFGAAAVLIGPGAADPTHPRVLRAATGAWFQIPIARSADLRADLAQLKAHGATILATDRHAAPLDQLNLPHKLVWLFGNEGAGIGSHLEPVIDQRVAVPIAQSVDSLNVNVAAGIILHHTRQRIRERSASCVSPPGT